jgi:hypothetical protein
MKEKVWFIDDSSWQEMPARTPRNDPPSERNQADSRSLSAVSGKSPALSFSLSMVVWGSGDLYSGFYRPGLIALAVMLFFSAPLFTVVFFRNEARLFVDRIGLSAAVLAAGGGIYLLAVLVCWLTNAVGSYHRTLRLRTDAFHGVDNGLWPLCGSILFPGWGQFLNGQPKKGLFFLLWGAAGIFAVFVLAATWFLWPGLAAIPAGPVLDICLIAAVAVFPLSLLMWIVSVYDSFVSCQQPFIDKLQRHTTGGRVRHRNLLKSLVPRWTAILALLLALSVGYQLVPAGYYRHTLEKIRIETKNRNMVLIPELIARAIDFMGGHW